MTYSENQLRDVLTERAGQAPVVSSVDVKRRSARPIRWSIVAPVGAAACAAALVFGMAAMAPSTNAGGTGSGAAAGGEAGDVTQLTGDELGRALGLEPETGKVVIGCENGAEHNDVAWCLDGVTTDPLEMRLLSLQIVGYPRNDTLVEYAKTELQLDELANDGHPPRNAEEQAETQALIEKLGALHKELVKAGD